VAPHDVEDPLELARLESARLHLDRPRAPAPFQDAVDLEDIGASSSTRI
jgi:hypothetical protein